MLSYPKVVDNCRESACASTSSPSFIKEEPLRDAKVLLVMSDLVAS